MKGIRITLIVVALVAITVPTFAKENRSGAGFAYTFGTVAVDIPGVPDADFTGYTIFWKQGFTDRWGLLISYRDMKDDENFAPGDEIKYTQFGVHAVVLWRHGKRVRPYIKFGVAQSDLEVTESSMGTASEDDTALSVGVGLEAGSERVAFYADWDYTQVELSGVDFELDNLALGIIFKY
jgi:hypothetical protein